MKKSLPLILFIAGCLTCILFLVIDTKFKANAFHSSVTIQKSLTRVKPHFLYYLMKTFEWVILVLTWVTLMLTLYLEFNKLTAWKLMVAVWDLSILIDFLRLILTGARPIFQNKTLAHNGCECTFGSPSWYTAFLLVFWVLFYNDVIKDRDFIKVTKLCIM
jgi:hypothetical protein